MLKINKHQQYQYVIAFLRQKTNQGVRQSAIAKSIGKSNTYVNWLILDKHKKKYIDRQVIEKIANFFDMTVPELLQTGKKIHDPKKQKSKKENNIIEIHLHIHFNGVDYVIPT